MKKLPDTITEEDALRMVKSARKNIHKVAIRFGFYQGLRISEVVKLKQSDVDMQRGLIHIRQSKGGKDRIIPLLKGAKHSVRHLPLKIGIRALERAINRISERAIGKRIKFHTLRHSCATWLLDMGKDIRFIQHFLGHSRIQTTQIYTHVNPRSLKKAFEDLI